MTTSSQLPIVFKERIINTFGEDGKTWLVKLPNLISDCEKRFNLKIKSPLPHLSYNYTAEAIQRDGSSIIVKFCVSKDEAKHEINALTFMHGNGMVNLLEADIQEGILLLEKLYPGKMLATLASDDKATAIAANVMQKIGKPISDTHHFPTTIQWFERLNKPINVPNGLPTTMIDKAKEIAFNLHQDKGELVLLHGDLHHFNILSAQRQPWLAIDPKGVIGEREYEVGALLRNPIPDIVTTMNTRNMLTRRINQLTEILGFDRQKIIGWSFAQAVLAAVWCLDGKSHDWKIFAKCAQVLSVI